MIPISVCIITRNEAERLEKCLSAIKPYGFEIVVVDTGSNDSSKEVAARYTDKLYDFEWVNDFSAARNYSISKASHNMILCLDTDEYITELDLEQLQTLIWQNPKSVGMIKRLDYFEDGGEKRCQICRIERIFNRKYYHYERTIHEVLVPLGNIPYTSYDVPLTAEHDGYMGSGEQLTEKALRDRDLLLEEIKADPNDPYNYFQVAQSYMLMRDTEHACEYFEIAMEHQPNPTDDYTPVLICNYGSLLLDNNKVAEAMSLLSYYDYYGDMVDYLCMVGRAYLLAGQPLKALPEFVKALTAPKRISVEAKVPSYYIGFIYELFGKKDIARGHYQSCGNYALALEALERLGH